MRRTGILVLLATCGLAACGGTTTKTVTVTKTVTAPAQATTPAPATTPPGGEDTTATTTPAPGSADASPLPDGVVAADGTHKMRTRQSDYTGENIAVDDEFPTDSEWIFTTSCQDAACSIAMRRELGSGAFKNVTLRPDPAREGVYVAETSGVREQQALADEAALLRPPHGPRERQRAAHGEADGRLLHRDGPRLRAEPVGPRRRLLARQPRVAPRRRQHPRIHAAPRGVFPARTRGGPCVQVMG